jgi:peptidoglycan L-alanyl-D-glutamate endopeptidase CwlK
MAHDKTTLKRIETAHPAIREDLKADYLHCNNYILGKGVRLRFTHVDRSLELQADLYSKGRTKPGKKVTNAKPGQSIHNYALAFDIVLLYDNDGNGSFEEASWDTVRDGDGDKKSDWMGVVKYFKSKGWFWGGDFKSIYDAPHFQKTFGYGWKDLMRLKRDRQGFVILKLT